MAFSLPIDMTLPQGTMQGGDPIRCIRSVEDMPKWERSQAYYDVLGFINGVSTAIQGMKISDNYPVSKTVTNLLELFEELNRLVDETPPVDQPQRFGNTAYRQWQRKMHHSILLMLQKALPQDKCNLLQEIGVYLSESFGNATRIDYGTGHEFSFIFFLCSLFKAEILGEEDIVAAAMSLFNTYLIFVRRLQLTYRMEPAGSQGVWALDDYQFIPFIWGSAQLAYHAPFDPPKFLEPEIIEKYKDDYLFIGCIDFINKVKTGHFAEHSNQLWSISAVPSWAKINQGLVKMYQKEVLSKFPVMQHVMFGDLMSFKPSRPDAIIQNARLGYPSRASVSSAMGPPKAPLSGSSSLKFEEKSLSSAIAGPVTTHHDLPYLAETKSDKQVKNEGENKEEKKDDEPAPAADATTAGGEGQAKSH